MSKKYGRDSGDGDYDDGEDYEDDEHPLSGDYEFLNQEDIINGNSENYYSEEKKKILEDILERDENSKCRYLADEGNCQIIHQKKNGDVGFPFQPNLKNLIIYCSEPLRAPSCKRYI
jgi:hypothetical protein|tara:strand:- start:34 stop:384 length:351 start_codon:yes stop_codon:yes gene_type:complete